MISWYQVIRCDNTVGDPYVAGVASLGRFDEWDFVYGKRIKNWNPASFFQTQEPGDDGDPDDVLQNVLGLPVYSRRLRAALDRSGIRGIQYLPVRVLLFDGTPIEGFAIANILHLVPCLNWEKSDYRIREDRPGTIRSYTKLVVRRSALEGYDILRMKEFKLDYFVSERFKSIFEGRGFTGYSFDPIRLSD